VKNPAACKNAILIVKTSISKKKL